MIHLQPFSTAAVVALAICFVLVCVFEFANGFHDTANAVATVIYSNSLKPKQAVVWSGLMNALGVIVGGIAVAYALVELLPPDTLTPPSGAPAVPMLVALFTTALAWNVLTWWFGIPNSSSHCVIGALIGIAIGDALVHARPLGQAVDWGQVWDVLRALAISPVLGFIGAGILYFVLKHVITDKNLFTPPKGDTPPHWGVRALLILTCTSVSFSHGTNDGQKSIGLIMLTVIGLLPAVYALNPAADAQVRQLADTARAAAPLIQKYGDDQKAEALRAVQQLEESGGTLQGAGADTGDQSTKSTIRGDVYRLVSEMKVVTANGQASAQDKADANKVRGELKPTVEYAPYWVRALSAICLGLGTMVGYKRIVETLGERVGKAHLNPGQGAAAELVGAGLIATAGFTGLPVSTTHIITSGIAATAHHGAGGVNRGILVQIALAWIFTLPVTIAVAAGLFYLMSGVVTS